jgi:hypothetical protein
MVDTQVVLHLAFLQPISATDLNEALMITGPGQLHAHSVDRDALWQASPEDAGDRALRAVYGPSECALVQRRQALRAGELADGIFSSSGAQT